MEIFRQIGLWVSTYIMITLLVVISLWFSFKTKFVQFRLFGEAVRVLFGKNGPKKARDKSQLSPLQAFCISVAAHVGTGNIAGVALAITLGGPGAIFWMWVMSLIGMASSFIENTLGQVFKIKDESGIFRGGPAFYIERGLKRPKLAFIFSLIITATFGFIFNSVQANTISFAFENAFGTSRALMGGILAVITALVIFGGIKRIAAYAQSLVSIFGVGYMLIAILVIALNLNRVPAVFGLIIDNAFDFGSFASGAFGVMFMEGVRRGLFSNEAGMGSTPNAASTAEVAHPANQGLVQMLGVFVDTILICTATAFIILIPGMHEGSDLAGVQLTQSALAATIGQFGYVFIAVSVFLFSFSSILGNYYYGESNIKYLKGKKAVLLGYRLLVIAMVIAGSQARLDDVWALSNLFMASMAIINLIAIFFLGKIALAVLQDYLAQKNAGIAQPIFDPSAIDGLQLEHWGSEVDKTPKQTKSLSNKKKLA